MKAKDVIRKICPQCLFRVRRKMLNDLKILLHRIQYFFLSKKMLVYCPCCDIGFKSFVDGGFMNHPYRFNSDRYKNIDQEVVCPICRSFPRHRILANWFESNLEILRSSKILYFAPEYGMSLWMKRNKISYTSADLFSEANLRVDIQSTELPDESYDVVICNHVLEHVDDFRMALKEMYRILCQGGSFICSFPMDPKIDLLDENPNAVTEEERIQRFGQNDHKRVFGMNADKFLAEAGFRIEVISGEACPNEIKPIVGPADYDINRLFRCVKVNEKID